MNTKQVKFLSELLQCSTITEACKRTGISQATAYRWMHNNNEFKNALKQRKTELLEDVSTNMQLVFSDAVNELLQIIKNKDASEQVKINAIDCLFRNARPIIEQVDILNRLQTIEGAIENDD